MWWYWRSVKVAISGGDEGALWEISLKGHFLLPPLFIWLLCRSCAFWLQSSHIIYHRSLFKRQLPPGSRHHSASPKLSLPCLIHTGGNHKSVFSLNDLDVLLSYRLLLLMLVPTSHYRFGCRGPALNWNQFKIFNSRKCTKHTFFFFQTLLINSSVVWPVVEKVFTYFTEIYCTGITM